MESNVASYSSTRSGRLISRGAAADAESGRSQARARQEGLSETSREIHDALTAAIEDLERALAAPAPGRTQEWSQRVAGDLETVRESIEADVLNVEVQDGLFDEVLSERPRLSRRLDRLREEHASLTAGAERLAHELKDSTVEISPSKIRAT